MPPPVLAQPKVGRIEKRCGGHLPAERASFADASRSSSGAAGTGRRRDAGVSGRRWRNADPSARQAGVGGLWKRSGGRFCPEHHPPPLGDEGGIPLVRPERRGHDLSRHVRAQQPVAVHGEHRRPSARGFARSGLKSAHSPQISGRPSPQTGSSIPSPTNHPDGRLEPARSLNCRVVPTARLRRDPDRDRHPQKAGPDQPLRRDRGATRLGGERVELGIQARQRAVDDLPDLAKRATRRTRSSIRT